MKLKEGRPFRVVCCIARSRLSKVSEVVHYLSLLWGYTQSSHQLKDLQFLLVAVA